MTYDPNALTYGKMPHAFGQGAARERDERQAAVRRFILGPLCETCSDTALSLNGDEPCPACCFPRPSKK